MFRWLPKPLRDQSIEVLRPIDANHGLYQRLRAAGIRTVFDLQQASEHSLKLAGCTDLERYAIRQALAKLPHDHEPKGAA